LVAHNPDTHLSRSPRCGLHECFLASSHTELSSLPELGRCRILFQIAQDLNRAVPLYNRDLDGFNWFVTVAQTYTRLISRDYSGSNLLDGTDSSDVIGTNGDE
jgi:hypothetical protein